MEAERSALTTPVRGGIVTSLGHCLRMGPLVLARIQGALGPAWMLPLLVGLGLRLFVAVHDVGYFALDDHFEVVVPASRYAAVPGFSFDDPIRSPLVPWALGRVWALGLAAGIDQPRHLIRFLYVALAVFSSTLVPLAHALASRTAGAGAGPVAGATAGRWAAWLVATHPLLLLVGSKALLESLSLPPLLAGFALVMAAPLATGRERALFALGGGVFLALSAMVRFQNGLFFLALLAVVLARRSWRILSPYLIAGGLVVLVAQGMLDLLTRGRFLCTPLSYLRYNLSQGHTYGTSPWYTYIPVLLALTLPPVTVFVLPVLWRGATQLTPVLAGVVTFLVAHSLAPHKEERFLIPVLPLLLALFAVGLATPNVWPRLYSVRFRSGLLGALIITTALFSFGVLLHISQRSSIDALEWLRTQGREVRSLASVGVTIAPLYGPPAQRIVTLPPSTPEAWRERVWGGDSALEPPTHVVVLAAEVPLRVTQLAVIGLSCLELERFPPSTVEGWLVTLNPEGNGRRGTSAVLECAPTGSQTEPVHPSEVERAESSGRLRSRR